MERSIHDEFIARMIEEVKKMKIGDPLDRSTAHGPQNHKYVAIQEQAAQNLSISRSSGNKFGHWLFPSLTTFQYYIT